MMTVKPYKNEKVYTIEGEKYRINDLFVQYAIKHGYEPSRESIKNKIRARLKKDARGHRKHILAKIIAK